MPVIEFRYRRERSPFGWVLRPLAGVLLGSGARRLEALMYVDSGADMTTIPLSAGMALGFKQGPRDRILEMRGISGGGVPYLLRELRVQIGGESFQARVAWALIEEIPFLLGRMDVFRMFDIAFLERKGMIVFTPTRKQ